jgi:hypothetical protein
MFTAGFPAIVVRQGRIQDSIKGAEVQAPSHFPPHIPFPSPRSNSRPIHTHSLFPSRVVLDVAPLKGARWFPRNFFGITRFYVHFSSFDALKQLVKLTRFMPVKIAFWSPTCNLSVYCLNFVLCHLLLIILFSII